MVKSLNLLFKLRHPILLCRNHFLKIILLKPLSSKRVSKSVDLITKLFQFQLLVSHQFSKRIVKPILNQIEKMTMRPACLCQLFQCSCKYRNLPLLSIHRCSCRITQSASFITRLPFLLKLLDSSNKLLLHNFKSHLVTSPREERIGR